MDHRSKEHNRKEISYERVLFFSDAVVAIAITLLALDLKIKIPEDQHLSFTYLFEPWHKYAAFILSFINIAGLWRTHHDFFTYIKKMNGLMLFLNISWLFFIITLPFSTSVMSEHFGDVPAVFLYSLNVLLLSVLQNFIWDYADTKTDFIDRGMLTTRDQKNFRWMLNLDMLNGVVAVAVSFFMPKTAFFLLFFKLPIFIGAAFFIAYQRNKKSGNRLKS